jgi:hypothetical protein
VIFDRVVQQGGADDVGVANPVVADNAQCDAEEAVKVRLALPPVCGVQLSGKLQCFPDLSLVGYVKTPGLDGQPGPQSPCSPYMAVMGVQGHHGDNPLLGVGDPERAVRAGLVIAICLPGDGTYYLLRPVYISCFLESNHTVRYRRMIRRIQVGMRWTGS